MSKLVMPTQEEILDLARVRSDACVSIYLETSALTLHADESRIDLNNHIRDALALLENTGFDKRRLAALKEGLEDVAAEADDGLFQSNSFALFATPDTVRIYRLANHLTSQMEVADRFYLKPLLRSMTFSHQAYILALSENEAKVLSLCPDADPEPVHIPDLPKSARDSLGLASITASTTSAVHGDGATLRKDRLARYSRDVNDALRPVARQERGIPVILVAAEPMASIFRSVATVLLADETVLTSPDKLPDHELVQLARPVLDAYYAKKLQEVRERFDQRTGQNRTVIDVQDAAKAATYGMVSLAMVDFDYQATGFVDDDGNVTFSEEPGAYGIVDEIVKRALEGGARVLAVRKEDMPDYSCSIAAILRYPFAPEGSTLTSESHSTE